MEYGLLLYGFQNVLEELLAPMSRQTTVLSLGGDAYLILLDADESGGAYDALCSSLESFHSFAKQELHLGLTCLLGRSAVPFRELPAEYLRLQEAHRNNVARTCGVLPLESGAAPPDVEPDFAKWQSLLDEGCGKAVREEIHAYFDRLSRQAEIFFGFSLPSVRMPFSASWTGGRFFRNFDEFCHQTGRSCRKGLHFIRGYGIVCVCELFRAEISAAFPGLLLV